MTGKWPHQQERQEGQGEKVRKGREERGEERGGGRGRGKGEEEREQAIQEQGNNCHIKQKTFVTKEIHIYGNSEVLQNLDSIGEKPNV